MCCVSTHITRHASILSLIFHLDITDDQVAIPLILHPPSSDDTLTHLDPGDGGSWVAEEDETLETDGTAGDGVHTRTGVGQQRSHWNEVTSMTFQLIF